MPIPSRERRLGLVAIATLLVFLLRAHALASSTLLVFLLSGPVLAAAARVVAWEAAIRQGLPCAAAADLESRCARLIYRRRRVVMRRQRIQCATKPKARARLSQHNTQLHTSRVFATSRRKKDAERANVLPPP